MATDIVNMINMGTSIKILSIHRINIAYCLFAMQPFFIYVCSPMLDPHTWTGSFQRPLRMWMGRVYLTLGRMAVPLRQIVIPLGHFI